MDIKILVATHKKYDMPSEDIYLPIHVGREGKEDLGYQGDNQGENISLKNSNYCELTGLYWAWKNLQCDVIGLSHYRRYFTDKSKFEVAKNKNNKMDLILNKQDIDKILKNADIIVPKKRNYYMVDHADFLLAVYDNNRKLRSGTGQTVNYALKQNLRIIFLHPDTAEIS